MLHQLTYELPGRPARPTSPQDRTGTSVASLLEILRTAQGDGGKVRQSAPVVPPPVQQPAQPPAQPPNAQLADLLAQLDDSNASASYTQRSSAFDGPSHGLIDPFGPVGTTPGLPRLDKGKGKRPAEELEEKADWGFTKCLPVLTELLRDEAFVKEVRKVSPHTSLTPDEERPGRIGAETLGAHGEDQGRA